MHHPKNCAPFLSTKVPLFAELPADQLTELLAKSQTRSYEANEAVAHIGDEASFFGVVLEGTLVASIPASGGGRQTLGRLAAGATFGELALMTGDKVLADLIAETRSLVLRIPVAVFQSIVVAHPGAVQRISQTVSERLKQVLADPAQAAAALSRSNDPYGLSLRSDRRERILVVNCGSSSLKYAFFDTEVEKAQARGLVERIGLQGTRHAFQGPKGKIERDLPEAKFPQAFEAMVAELTARDTGVIANSADIGIVAHRVVHGGEQFSAATLITDDVQDRIQALSALAQSRQPGGDSRDAPASPERSAHCHLRHCLSSHPPVVRLFVRVAARVP